jgi:hypothetical protein
MRSPGINSYMWFVRHSAERLHACRRCTGLRGGLQYSSRIPVQQPEVECVLPPPYCLIRASLHCCSRCPTRCRGTRDKLAAGLAADWLERLAFCVGAEELMETFGEHYTYDFWRPPKHMSQCKVGQCGVGSTWCGSRL